MHLNVFFIDAAVFIKIFPELEVWQIIPFVTLISSGASTAYVIFFWKGCPEEKIRIIIFTEMSTLCFW